MPLGKITIQPGQETLSPEQSAQYDALHAKLCALYLRDQFEIHDRILVFHDELKVKYPDARQYLMFHLISGSTFLGFNGKFDFPPDDSVEHFIEREYREAFDHS